MKLLLNNKEIANFLISLINLEKQVAKRIDEVTDFNLNEVTNAFAERESERKRRAMLKGQDFIPPKDHIDDAGKNKLYEKIFKGVSRDLELYVRTIKEERGKTKQDIFHGVHSNIETFIERLGKEYILQKYQKSPYKDFVKGTGNTLTKNPQLIRGKEFKNYKEDCLIRNTVGNEELLVTKIDKQYPMWFIDSGYTNFLEPNKKWHRLVRNHMHFGKSFDAPTSRLKNFPIFPVPWRKNGEIIYVIEPGPFAANVFHINLKTWKYDVAKELRKYTDKRIVFRKKAPLRQRPKLIKQLLDEDYCCVVSINSNAATEAIWAGIPAITLGTHITNPVTRNKLSDINDLYYGDISKWLCMLSYSQFTKEELINGTAKRIVDKYHG